MPLSGTGLQPGILDNTAAISANLPTVFQVVISATATVQILGALEIAQSSGLMVDPQDISGGGFTSGDFYDLISGLPFYQVNIVANTGTVKVKASCWGSMAPGVKGKTQLLRFTNAATQGM